MKSMLFLTIFLAGSVFVFACTQEGDLSQSPQSGLLYQSNFAQGKDGWEADFTDYGTQQSDMRFESAWTSLPAPLDANRKAMLYYSNIKVTAK